MTRLTVRGTAEGARTGTGRAFQSFADECLLDALRARRDDADRLVAEIRACDDRRAELDIELDRRKTKLDDPALAGHPKRPAAVTTYETLEAEATLIPFTRRRLADDLERVIAKAAALRHRLSPAAQTDGCVAIWGEAFCVGVSPEADAWAAVGYPRETAAWQRRRDRERRNDERTKRR